MTFQFKESKLRKDAEVPHAVGFRRSELGAAVGRAPLSAVGITNDSFGRRIAQAVVAADIVMGSAEE